MEDHVHGDSTIQGPSMAPKLQMLRGDSPGETYPLKFKTRIGRETDNDIAIVDPRISRYHFQISYEEGKWMLSDLGSVNGTSLNGLPVTVPQALTHGDQITIGETVLVFRDPTIEKDLPFDGSTTIHGRSDMELVTPRSTVSKRRLLWIVGGLVLILIVLIVGLILWLGRDANTASTTELSAETPQEFIILRTTPRPEQNLDLKYEEDFSDSFGGWDDAFGKTYTKQYGNNRYHIEITTNSLVVWGLANRLAQDFDLEVEATREDGDVSSTYGLIFRYVDHDNYYRFDVSSDGYFLLSKFQDGQWRTLADWQSSEAINQGQTAVNALKVSANGPEIILFANGQELTRVSDDAFQEGNFGFFASTFDDSHIWVSFDDLKLWAPPDQEIVQIPTPALTTIALAPAAKVAEQATLTPISAMSAATATPTLPPTTAPAETQTSTTAPQAEPVATATPTAEPVPLEAETPTPTPTSPVLPSFVSRDQPLARGEQALPGKIYFPLYDPARGAYDIYRANLNGSDRELVQAEASQPALNSEGTIIAYRSWKADERGLTSRPLDSQEKWIFVSFFEAASPAFSDDEQFFVFHSRQGGQTPALYRTFGTEHAVLRRESIPIQGEMVALTSDNRMVYRGCTGNSCGLVISNLDGSFPQQLTDYADDNVPSISPDEQTIAFMSNRAGNWDVYAIDIDGQNLRQLTDDPGNDGLPTWSPEGNFIAFVTSRDGEWAIWDMLPNGNQKRQLFSLRGSIDGIVQVDTAYSFGWLEERIIWSR